MQAIFGSLKKEVLVISLISILMYLLAPTSCKEENLGRIKQIKEASLSNFWMNKAKLLRL